MQQSYVLQELHFQMEPVAPDGTGNSLPPSFDQGVLYALTHAPETIRPIENQWRQIEDKVRSALGWKYILHICRNNVKFW